VESSTRSVCRASGLVLVANPSRTAAPLSRIRLDANAIIDWVPAKGRSAALAVAHSECSGERSPGSLLSAHPQDTEWRTSSLGRTGAFLVGLGQAPEDLKVSI